MRSNNFSSSSGLLLPASENSSDFSSPQTSPDDIATEEISESIPQPKSNIAANIEQITTNLHNDNKRLLSQNIALCQAVKRQKSQIDVMGNKNITFQQQITKLCARLKSLSRTQKEKLLQDEMLQNSIQREMAVLKHAIVTRDDQISQLSSENNTLICQGSEYKGTMKAFENDILKQRGTVQTLELEKQSMLIDFKNETNTLHRRIDDSQSRITELTDELSSVRSQYKQLQLKLDDAHQQCTDQSLEIRRLSENDIITNAQLRATEKELLLVRRETEKFKSENAELNNTYNNTTTELSIWKDRASKADISLNETNRTQLETIDKLNDRYASKLTEIETLQCDKTELQKNFESLQSDHKTLRQKHFSSLWKKSAEKIASQQQSSLQSQVTNATPSATECDRSQPQIQQMNRSPKKQRKWIENTQNCEPENTQNSERENTESSEHCLSDIGDKNDSNTTLNEKLADKVKQLRLDNILLSGDTKELTDFIINSRNQLSAETQLQVASKLLPLVEEYRKALTSDIKKRINSYGSVDNTATAEQ